ncbi:hypothetical protein J7L81_05645 [Candidatus Aerophobetes bacterium]|nr:hypothetical protein [Candidatus Aerophobetes bacterium]
MLEVGREVIGNKVLIPRSKLENWESIKGQIYEIQIKTENRISDDVASKIVGIVPKKLYEKFGAKVKYMRIMDNYIIMQIEGSPFSWSSLLPYLSSILTWLGLIVIAIAVLLIIQKAPWEVFLLLIGLILALGAPDIAEAIKKHLGVKEEKKIVRKIEVE